MSGEPGGEVPKVQPNRAEATPNAVHTTTAFTLNLIRAHIPQDAEGSQRADNKALRSHVDFLARSFQDGKSIDELSTMIAENTNEGDQVLQACIAIDSFCTTAGAEALNRLLPAYSTLPPDQQESLLPQIRANLLLVQATALPLAILEKARDAITVQNDSDNDDFLNNPESGLNIHIKKTRDQLTLATDVAREMMVKEVVERAGEQKHDQFIAESIALDQILRYQLLTPLEIKGILIRFQFSLTQDDPVDIISFLDDLVDQDDQQIAQFSLAENYNDATSLRKLRSMTAPVIASARSQLQQLSVDKNKLSDSEVVSKISQLDSCLKLQLLFYDAYKRDMARSDLPQSQQDALIREFEELRLAIYEDAYDITQLMKGSDGRIKPYFKEKLLETNGSPFAYVLFPDRLDYSGFVRHNLIEAGLGMQSRVYLDHVTQTATAYDYYLGIRKSNQGDGLANKVYFPSNVAWPEKTTDVNIHLSTSGNPLIIDKTDIGQEKLTVSFVIDCADSAVCCNLVKGSNLTIKETGNNYDPVNSSFQLSEATLTIPDYDNDKLLETKISASNSDVFFVSRDGSRTMIHLDNIKDRTLREILSGYKEMRTSEFPRLTEGIFASEYSSEAVAGQLKKDKVPPEFKGPIEIGNRQYTVIGELGGGKYCEAYMAKDKNGNYCVIKYAHADLDQESQKEFKSESSRITAFGARQREFGWAVDNNILVPEYIFDGEHPKKHRPLLIMSYAEGVPMDEIIRGNQISTRDCLTIVSQFANVLESLHFSGYSYLDFQPKNIRWNPFTGRITCIDFNLLNSLGEGDKKSLIQEDIINATKLLYRLVTRKGTFGKDSRVITVDNKGDLPGIGDLREIFSRGLSGEYSKALDFGNDLRRLITEHDEELSGLLTPSEITREVAVPPLIKKPV